MAGKLTITVIMVIDLWVALPDRRRQCKAARSLHSTKRHGTLPYHHAGTHPH